MVFKVIPPDPSDISRVRCERLERYLNSPEMIEEIKRPMHLPGPRELIASIEKGTP